MRVSWKWLNEYVSLDGLTVSDVTKALTSIGLEVEGVETLGEIDPAVVVARIVEAGPHPGADKLRICRVDAGSGELLQIVCGAPNARAGIYVALAQIGAKLPGDFKIKRSKIRGEESFGMLCSAQELGIGDDHAGIIEIPGTPPLGKPVSEVLDTGDTVIEVSLTPNRADCNGMLGIARDLAAKLGRPFERPTPNPTRASSLTTESAVRVKITDKDACARFTALRVTDVRPVASPAWLKARLTAAGMRPINLIVDVTNYVMLEFGQPIHAYDERRLKGGLIEVRRAKAGEKLVTLDGQERALETDDILICDGEGPIGLAGIMGGANTEVADDTTSVVVEVAYFAPVAIRKTSRRLGLHTEASHRFERGVDIEALPDVSLRVAELLQKAAGELAAQGIDVPAPKVAVDLIDVYPEPVQRSRVAVRLSRARQLLALPSLTQEKIVSHLGALGFKLLDQNEDRTVFEIPPWRVDIEREADLIEEVARLEGYDTIPYQLPSMSIRPTPENPFFEFSDAARTTLASVGLVETIGFAFVSKSEMAALRVEERHPLMPRVTLKNPLSEEFSLLRTTLVPGLLRAALGNRRRGAQGVRLFEVGRGYFDFRKSPLDEASHPLWKGLDRAGLHLPIKARLESRPAERNFVAAVLDQPWREKSWNGAEEGAGFYQGKAVVEALARAFGVALVYRLADQAPEVVPYLHPKRGAHVLTADGQFVGYVGELDPRAALALDFGEAAPVVLELDLERLYEARGKKREIQKTSRRFPPVTRDLAFVVDRGVTHGDFEGAVREFKRRRHLTQFSLFDVYQGDRLPADKKSMAYSFAFQSQERTLTDKEVENEIEALVTWLGERLGATLRA